MSATCWPLLILFWIKVLKKPSFEGFLIFRISLTSYLQPFFIENLIMKAATVKEIKSELESLSNEELITICQRLARFKKENKELLTYLLFEAYDENSYIAAVKSTIDTGFDEMNKTSLYIAKKNLRKIIRTASKFIRYSGNESTEVEILIYLCNKIKTSELALDKSTVMKNMYASLLKKIHKAISTMHEDLQYDFNRQLQKL